MDLALCWLTYKIFEGYKHHLLLGVQGKVLAVQC